MKADPINIILENNFEINKKFYFISGNETTLMQKIKDLIMYKIFKSGDYSLERIKSISLKDFNAGLFSKHKLYLISEVGKLNNEILNSITNTNDIYIFLAENSPKTKTIKNIFLKRSDSLVFDCYELSKDMKMKIVKYFLEKNKIELKNELFWGLVDMLDNKYLILENELEKIKALNKSDINNISLNKLFSRNNNEIEEIFFQILNSNETLINNYNQKITNISDVNSLFYIFKKHSYLLLSYENRSEFEQSIPKYLFRERGFFLTVFSKLNKNKKRVLINMLFKTESLIRKNSSISIVMGLRFLLKYKKVITS